MLTPVFRGSAVRDTLIAGLPPHHHNHYNLPNTLPSCNPRMATRTSDTLSEGLDIYVLQIEINFLASYSVIHLAPKWTPGIPYFEERRVVPLAWVVNEYGEWRIALKCCSGTVCVETCCMKLTVVIRNFMLYDTAGMRSITTLRPTTDRIYDGGPVRL